MMKQGLGKLQGKLAGLLALVLLLSVGLPGIGVLAAEGGASWNLRIYSADEAAESSEYVKYHNSPVLFFEADCPIIIDALISNPKLKQTTPPGWSDEEVQDNTFWSFGYRTTEYFFNYMLEKNPRTSDEFNKYEEEFFKLSEEEYDRIFGESDGWDRALNPGITQADADEYFEKFDSEAYFQGITFERDGKIYSDEAVEPMDPSDRPAVEYDDYYQSWLKGEPACIVKPFTSYENGTYWSSVMIVKLLPVKPDGDIRLVSPTPAAENAVRAEAAIKQVRALVNGKELKGGVAPYIQDGRTMGPLRAVADAFGYDVAWDGETKTITLKDEHTTIVMKIGEREYEVNGKKDNFEDAVPSIKDGSTFLPMRGLADIVDAEVTWDAETSTASFTKK